MRSRDDSAGISMYNVREAAFRILNKCASAEQYSNIALDTALQRSDFSPSDRGLLTTLVYGTLERQLTLDHCISHLSKRPDNEVDADTRILLRMGIYQLAYLDRIPDHAAVNETVALAPKRSRAFVNALLRAFLRANKQIPLPDRATAPIDYLSVRYSFHPDICRAFCDAYGLDRTELIVNAFCNRAPLTLRVNTLRISRDGLLQKLTDAGYDAKPTAECESGIVLESAPVTELPGFEDGWFFVQDEASQLCVEALNARPDASVLDVCACPGSKSFGAAADMQNRGRLIACDLHANKLSLVRSGAARLGISILETVARDAREHRADWDESFDRVLCDVPCSGFGVFAKKPELRYKDPQKSEALPDIQLAILNNAAQYVKQGGNLVYSTCTLLPRENGENVNRFLSEHPNFVLLRERTLFPDTDGTDGFYFAVLQRIGGDALV